MTNTTYSKKVLVLGSDTRSFLSVIRSLGRKNIDVHVAWCDAGSATLYSRYIKKIHDIPRYDTNKSNWLNQFIEILKCEEFDLVIPCNDQSIIPLQYNRLILEKHATIYLLDDDIFEICNSKSKVTELAKKLDIFLPNYIVTSNNSEIIQFAEKHSYPIVLKPTSSFTKDKLDERLEVKKAFNLEELLSLSKKMLQYGELQVQENFIGEGVGVEVLANHGKILTAFQHVRVHEPMMGGGSSYRKSVNLDNELFNATSKLIAALNYTGVAMVEFKVNKDLSKWILIEINARFWGSLPLSIASGINFPYWLYQMIVFNKTNFPRNYKNLFCRNTLLDYYWMISNLKANRNNPVLATLPLSQVALEVLNIVTFKERNDTLQLDDIYPAAIELKYLANKFYNSTRKQVLLYLKNTYLNRKYQYYKCKKNIAHAHHVLFVCYGNICRSPFAELYARDIFPSNITISSCGLHDKVNRQSPEIAINAASEFNIDLAKHRSVQITKDIVNQADIIFTFDDLHYDPLIKKYPWTKKYTHMISSLNLDLPRTINDPYNNEQSYFIDTYDAIKKSVSSLANKINIETDNPKILVKKLSNINEFKGIKTQWTELLQESDANQLFLSWEWQYSWWETWAETLGLKLYILLAYSEEKLIGIAPLYIDRVRLKCCITVNRIQFIGNSWRKAPTVRTEYLEFITSKDQSIEVCAVLTEHLSITKCWDEFVICDIQTNSNTYQEIQKNINNRNWYIDIANKDQGIKIKVTGKFEDYLGGLGHNTRLKLFNRRKYLNSLGEVTRDNATNNQLNYYFSNLNSLHKSRWGNDCFSEQSLNFHKALINRLNDKQSYSINCIKIDDKPISVLYDLIAGNTEYNIQSGFNQTFDKKLSLGTLHMGYAIEDSFNTPNISNFDMLAGSGKSEFYKSRYKGVDVEFITLRITLKHTLKVWYIINHLVPHKFKKFIHKIRKPYKRIGSQ